MSQVPGIPIAPLDFPLWFPEGSLDGPATQHGPWVDPPSHPPELAMYHLTTVEALWGSLHRSLWEAPCWEERGLVT